MFSGVKLSMGSFILFQTKYDKKDYYKGAKVNVQNIENTVNDSSDDNDSELEYVYTLFEEELENQQHDFVEINGSHENINGLVENQNRKAANKALKSKKRTKSQFETHVKIGKISISVQIDSGSGVNVLDVKTLKNLKTKVPTINLKRSKTKLFAYGTNTPLETLGCFETFLESDKRFAPVIMYVAKKASGNLLSGDTAIDLGLLNLNKINQVTTDVNQPTSIGSDKQDVEQNKSLNQTLADDSKIPSRLKPLIAEYKSLFHGGGKLHNYQAHLHIDQVVPVIQPVHRIPFAMRDKVEKELERLQSLHIIEDVEETTPWVSLIVCVPKANSPDAARLCIDMRLPNTAIMREHHPSPTLEDLIAKYPSVRIVGTFTTVITHKGLKRFKRLTFGADSASEIY